MDGFQVLVACVLTVEWFLTNWTHIVAFSSWVEFLPVYPMSCLAFKFDFAKTTILFKSFLVDIFVVSEQTICAVETFCTIFTRILLIDF